MIHRLFKSETHTFEAEGRPILFDVLGGNFFEIDDVTRDVLDACDGQAPEEIVRGLCGRHDPEDVRSALEELERAEILTEQPIQIAPFHPPSRIEITHLSLCVTGDRPHPMGEGGGNRRRSPVRGEGEVRPLYTSEAVAVGAVDFLLRESGGLRDCEMTFEGGEALLNVPLIRRVMDYGEERACGLGKRISFEVLTDGTLLTPRMIDYFIERDVAVVLEVGAERDMETLERVASLVASLRPVRLHIQIVADGRGLDLSGRTEILLRLFPSALSIGVRWANLPPRHPDALRAERLSEVRSALRRVGRQTLAHLLRGGGTILEEMEGAAAQLAGRQALLYGCGAGTRSAAVSPEGGLFPCFDLIGWPSWRMGDVFSGIDSDRYRGWLQDLHVERRRACRGCWARYLCGGGCWGDAALTNGDVARPNPVSCERLRHTYEQAMAVCVAVEREAPGLIAARYLTDQGASHEVRVSDEHPVLERYA